MKLTNRYRLVWDDDNNIIGDPFYKYSENSITETNKNCYEAKSKLSIENKIKELNLIKEVEDVISINS